MWGGEGSFSYGDELKSWRRASKGRAFYADGKRDLYTVDEERLRWKVFIGGAREIVVR